MAVHCMDLVKGNHLSNKVVVIAGKIEEVWGCARDGRFGW